MNSPANTDEIVVQLNSDEFRIWIRGVVEAFEEVPHAEFQERLGFTLEDSRDLRTKLRAIAQSSDEPRLMVRLPRSTIERVWLCLRAAMTGLGDVEFETRVGDSWEYGLQVLGHLTLLQGQPGDGLEPAEVGQINS